MAAPLTSPQSHLFNWPGEAGTIKALFGLGPYFDIGPTVGLIGLPSSSSNLSSDTGVGWQLGGGFRLRWSHDAAAGRCPGPHGCPMGPRGPSAGT